MKYGNQLILSMFLFIPSALIAGTVIHSDVQVTDIYAGYSGGYINFTVSQPHINPAGCRKFTIYRADAGQSDVKSVLSVLLAAKTTQSLIDVSVYDNLCSSGGEFPVISRIRVK